MKQINYYETYQDDFVQSQDQEYKLPEDYKWIHKNPIYKLFSEILYRIAYIISLLYCRFFLHIKIKNAKILKKWKSYSANRRCFYTCTHLQRKKDICNSK